MGHALRKSDPYKPINTTNSTPGDASTKTKRRGPFSSSTTPMVTRKSEDRSSDATVKSSGDSLQLPALANERAKEILRSTWSDDFGVLFELGTDIYSEIFRLAPAAKHLFPALDDYDLERDPTALRQCAAFNKQALRFIQTVSMTIQNSSHLNTIDAYLKDIGRRHVQYKPRGFQPHYWDVFEEAMCNVMTERAAKLPALNEEDRKMLTEAYQQLSRHIIAVMTEGFRAEEKAQL